MNIPEITSLISAIKSAAEISRFILDKTKDIQVRSKIIDLQNIISDLQGKIFTLQSLILSLQKENMELEYQIKDLKKQIIENEQWDETQRRYKLISLGSGSQAYRYQPEEGSDTPIHYLCANCFNSRKKSILQKTGYAHDGAIYKCFTCQAEIKDFTDKPPSYITTIKRREPFPGF
jgi:cell division protein FtsB